MLRTFKKCVLGIMERKSEMARFEPFQLRLFPEGAQMNPICIPSTKRLVAAGNYFCWQVSVLEAVSAAGILSCCECPTRERHMIPMKERNLLLLRIASLAEWVVGSFLVFSTHGN